MKLLSWNREAKTRVAPALSRQVYSVREFAQLLGMNVKTVRKLIADGQLPVIRLGRAKPGARRPYLLRIPRTAVESFLQGRVLPP